MKYKIVLWIVFLVVVSLFIGSKINRVEYNADNKVVVTSTKSELEKIMEEENFKKITVLRARKVANDNKKAIEVERNKTAISAIESEYEAIRASEIELVGKSGDVSLK